MSLRDGVGYMVRVYNVAPSSIQVKKNLEGMLCNLAASCAETPNLSDEQILNKALRDTGSTFKAKVEEARIQGELSAIVDKVNRGTMKKDDALSAVFTLYKKDPDNDRICENLVTLCDMCIMEYVVGQKTGKYGVKTILDNLNNNKSSTFRRHAVKLSSEYSKIWSQLPVNTRMLLQGLGAYNQILTPQGEALKEGLEYYKKLGGHVSSRSGRSSIFDLLNQDDLPF